MTLLWQPLVINTVNIIFPLEKKPSSDEKKQLNDQDTDNHVKSN